MTSQDASEKTQRTAWLLSAAGLIPCFAGATYLLLAGFGASWSFVALLGVITYGAVILSFLGGIRWGLAVAAPESETASTTLIASTVPSLIGWAATLCPVPYALALLIAGFVGQAYWDWRAGKSGIFEPWFANLRMKISGLVILTLVNVLVIHQFFRLSAA